MKKTLVCIMAILLVLSFVGCAQAPVTADVPQEPDAEETEAIAPEADEEEIDESWTKIEAQGSFVLGFDAGFAPMGFKDESGEYVGFDIDLATELASRLGLELELQPIDWEAKFLELDAGNIDMVWNGLTITEPRKLETLFSDPYMHNEQIIIVRADSDIKTKADLAGKIVAAQVESSAISAMRAEPDVMDSFGELIESSDYVQALTELKLGSVDAVVVDEIAGLYYIQLDDPAFYSVLTETFGSELYGIGFRLGDKALRDKFQEVLNEMIADGTAAAISDKWFGDNVLISQ